MKTVMDRLPAFTFHGGRPIDNGRPGARGDVATLVNAAASRTVLAIVTPLFTVDVSVEGVTAAFGDDLWTEPEGFVTLWTADGWLVVAIDAHPHLPDIQLHLDAERVAGVLVDIALARCFDPTRPAGGR